MLFKTSQTPCLMATWWLTNEESQNSEFMNSLKPMIRQYQREGYITATFISGEQNLESNTHQLMKHNYELRANKTNLVPFIGCEVFLFVARISKRNWWQHLYYLLHHSDVRGIMLP